MKRVSVVRVDFENGNYAKAVVTTNLMDCLRSEVEHQHDKAVDQTVDALRALPYVANAPLRAVSIR